LSENKAYNHWRRLVKNIGGNQKHLGEKVVMTMNAWELLNHCGSRARAAPKVYVYSYNIRILQEHLPKPMSLHILIPCVIRVRCNY